MVSAPWTEVRNTPNKSIRQNVGRRGAILHHAAMTNLDELIRLEMGAKQVSSTAVIKDDRIVQMMPLDIYRPWSVSDAYWDSAMRSVETCNESISGYTISAASHESLAKVVAYWAQIDGFYPHRSGDPKTWTVIGHREVNSIHHASYATACPGAMDLDWIVKRAQQILAVTSGGETSPIVIKKEDIMSYVIVKRDDPAKPWFSLVGPNGVQVIASAAQLRGVQKVMRALRADGNAPEVALSGEEWDAGTLGTFDSNVAVTIEK